MSHLSYLYTTLATFPPTELHRTLNKSNLEPSLIRCI